jgi:hypothetical protein
MPFWYIKGTLIGNYGLDTKKGAPQKKFWWGTLGAPRLSDQSDRVSILGVGTSSEVGLKETR